MNIPRPLLIATYLAGLTLVSCLAGVVLGHHLGRATAEQRSNHEYWNERALADIDRKVGLRPEQRERIRAHLDQAVEQLRAVRGEALARTGTIITRLVEQAEGEMDAGQRTAFQEIKPKARDLVSIDLLKVDRPAP
jgi:hypothetical protein